MLKSQLSKYFGNATKQAFYISQTKAMLELLYDTNDKDVLVEKTSMMAAPALRFEVRVEESKGGVQEWCIT